MGDKEIVGKISFSFTDDNGEKNFVTENFYWRWRRNR